VDYLLTNPKFTLMYAISAGTKNRLECHLARALGGTSVPGFGCSDCSCSSHLVYRYGDPVEEILAAFRNLRLVPVTKTIMSLHVEG
jgi:Uri superfamily endonuclease